MLRTRIRNIGLEFVQRSKFIPSPVGIETSLALSGRATLRSAAKQDLFVLECLLSLELFILGVQANK